MHTLKQSVRNPNWWDVGYYNPFRVWICIQACMSYDDAIALVNKLNGGH